MRRSLIALCCAVLLAACGFEPGGDARRADPALDSLFAELAAAPDAGTAEPIETRIWEHWADSGSPTVDVLLERAAAAQDAGDAERAFRFLNEASTLAPDYAEPWNRRANLFYASQDYANAISAIEQALQREPRHFGALGGLGLIYEELGQDRQALDAYRAALAVHPHYETALRGVARLEPRVDGRDA